jgi:hypothetical protein
LVQSGLELTEILFLVLDFGGFGGHGFGRFGSSNFLFPSFLLIFFWVGAEKFPNFQVNFLELFLSIICHNQTVIEIFVLKS